MANSFGDAAQGVFRGIDSVSNAFQQKRQLAAQEDQRLKISGLLEDLKAGDTSTLGEIAMLAGPEFANVLLKSQGLNIDQSQFQQQQEQEARKQGILKRVNIAQQALNTDDPTKARAILNQIANDSDDPEIVEDIADDLNKDDDALMFELQTMVSEGKAILGEQVEPLTQSGTIQNALFASRGDAEKARGFVSKSFEKTPATQVNIGGQGATPELPASLTEGLTPEVAQRARDTFVAAGGGKDGLKAVNTLIGDQEEVARRDQVPGALATLYPKATPEESEQLKSIVDSAETVEKGIQEAAKVREEQRRVKKAKDFQNRAVSLLDKILSNPELGDVLGSVEGLVDFELFSDEEAEAIADIQEAQNILTADNLDLMTGVLSETDIAIIKSLAGGSLNRKRREKRFIDDVTNLRNKISGSKNNAKDKERIKQLRDKLGL